MTESPLVGTRMLVSWEVTQLDGLVRHYGRNVVGYLAYAADGCMFAEIMDPGRQQSDPGFPLEIAATQSLSDPDRARAYTTYLSYCGTHTVAGDIVAHHVHAGLIPSWTGSEQLRRFGFEDGRLIIGRGRSQVLIWQRAVRHG